MKANLMEMLVAERTNYLKLANAIEMLLDQADSSSSVTDNTIALRTVHNGNAAEKRLTGVTGANLKSQVIPVKVLFALREIKSGTAKDVAAKLIELSPGYKATKAFTDSRHHLSKMHVAKMIQAKLTGNKNTYVFPNAFS